MCSCIHFKSTTSSLLCASARRAANAVAQWGHAWFLRAFVHRAHVLRQAARPAERSGTAGARVIPALLVHRAHVRIHAARLRERSGAVGARAVPVLLVHRAHVPPAGRRALVCVLARFDQLRHGSLPAEFGLDGACRRFCAGAGSRLNWAQHNRLRVHCARNRPTESGRVRLAHAGCITVSFFGATSVGGRTWRRVGTDRTSRPYVRVIKAAWASAACTAAVHR